MSEKITSRAEEVVSFATKNGLTVGTAESCTGGLICGALTSIPGSSSALRGGVVSYDPEIKHDVLGVPQEIIDDPNVGVVSSECAEAMALGALRVLGCSVAVSVTGIAGPGGAEPGKPVGTVWFGLATKHRVTTEVQRFNGTREDVRRAATYHALSLLYGGLEELTSAI